MFVTSPEVKKDAKQEVPKEHSGLVVPAGEWKCKLLSLENKIHPQS